MWRVRPRGGRDAARGPHVLRGRTSPAGHEPARSAAGRQPPTRHHGLRPAPVGGTGSQPSAQRHRGRHRPARFRLVDRRAGSMDASLIVVAVVLTELVFDFTNGFHDTANAMATSIATGAFRPRMAVAVAACLNLAGAFLSVQVAKTISGGLVDEKLINPVVIFAGLIGAILWNLLTWFAGLPSSSSHALFGGLIGATWVAGGADAINFTTVVNKVVLPPVLSPVIAALIAVAATYLALRVTRRADPGVTKRGFTLAQRVSASMVALAHGTNDAQKTMGVITLTLITAGMLPAGSAPPLWVVLAAGLAIGLGTYMGGWRIIRTLGRRMSDIRPVQGFTAETTSASVILTSTHLGLPLSTTQVCTGSILGAAAGRR